MKDDDFSMGPCHASWAQRESSALFEEEDRALAVSLNTRPDNWWARLRMYLAGLDFTNFWIMPVELIIELLDRWPVEEEREAAISYAQEHLQDACPDLAGTFEGPFSSCGWRLHSSWAVPFAQLPDTRELNPELFAHLHTLKVDLAGCHIARDMTGWEEGGFSLALLGGMQALQALSFHSGIGIAWGTWLIDAVHLPRLHTLDLSRVNVSGLAFLSGFPALRSLKIDGVTLESFDGIELASQLQSLEIHNVSKDAELSCLSRLVCLETLCLGSVSSGSLATLLGPAHLQALQVRRLPQDARLSFLAALSTLKELHLGDVSAAQFEELSQASELRSLHLGETPHGVSVAPLLALQKLEELEIRSTQPAYFTDWNRLASLPALRTLTVVEASHDSDLSVLEDGRFATGQLTVDYAMNW